MTALAAVEPVHSLIDEARAALDDTGIFVIEEPIDDAAFRSVCAGLGETVYEAEIKLGADRPRNYQLPERIDFHTDHVLAEIVAWHCVAVEPGGGIMQFLDLAKVAAQLSEDQRQALTRVGITDNAAWGGGAPIAMAYPKSGRLRFHYVPWLDNYPADAEARAALAAFEDAFRAASRKKDFVAVDLQPGQCVFLDNHRVTHGRDAISQDSPRHLTRLWLAGGGT